MPWVIRALAFALALALPLLIYTVCETRTMPSPSWMRSRSCWSVDGGRLGESRVEGIQVRLSRRSSTKNWDERTRGFLTGLSLGR